MNAKDFVTKHGKEAIGRMVMCEAIGSYSGGPATVVSVDPEDDGNIQMFVESKLGRMGIIWDEHMEFIPKQTAGKNGLKEFNISLKKVYTEHIFVEANSKKGAETLALAGQGKIRAGQFEKHLEAMALPACKLWEKCNVKKKCPLCRDD